MENEIEPSEYISYKKEVYFDFYHQCVRIRGSEWPKLEIVSRVGDDSCHTFAEKFPYDGNVRELDIIGDGIHAVIMGLLCIEADVVDEYQYYVDEETPKSFREYVEYCLTKESVEFLASSIIESDREDFLKDARTVAEAYGIALEV